MFSFAAKASFQPGTPEMAACLQMLSKHGTIRSGVGWRFLKKKYWCTHVFFHSNNLVGWLIRVSGMIRNSPRIWNRPMNQPTFRIYQILQDALRWGGSVGRWDIEREFLFHKHVIGHGISSTTRLGQGGGQCWFMMYWMKPLVSFDPQIQCPEFSHGL